MELLTLKLFLLFSLPLLSKMTDTRENITPDYGSHFSCKIVNKTDAITFYIICRGVISKCKNSTTESV